MKLPGTDSPSFAEISMYGIEIEVPLFISYVERLIYLVNRFFLWTGWWIIRVRSMWSLVVSLPFTVPDLWNISRSTINTDFYSLTLLLLRRHLGHKAEVSSNRVSTIVKGHYSSWVTRWLILSTTRSFWALYHVAELIVSTSYTITLNESTNALAILQSISSILTGITQWALLCMYTLRHIFSRTVSVATQTQAKRPIPGSNTNRLTGKHRYWHWITQYPQSRPQRLTVI